MKVAKKVVYYLKGTMYLRLIYRAQVKDKRETKISIALSPFRLVRYGDSNSAGDPKDKNSIMRYYYFINGAIISWCSKKQKIVSMSTIEAKYIILGHTAWEAI